MFSDEDVRQCETPNVGSDVVRAIMAKAAELLAARDSSNDSLEHMRERLSATEESVRDLTRRAQQAEETVERLRLTIKADRFAYKNLLEERRRLEARCATLSAASRVLSEHVDKAEAVTEIEAYGLLRTGDGARWPQRHPHAFQPDGSGFCQWVMPGESGICGYSAPQHRWPCSPTCAHDDAATPGHPERVKERSVAVAKTIGGLTYYAALSPHERTVFERGQEDGAEAMRAACWEAVQEWAQGRGLTREEQQSIKCAIEGATP